MTQKPVFHDGRGRIRSVRMSNNPAFQDIDKSMMVVHHTRKVVWFDLHGTIDGFGSGTIKKEELIKLHKQGAEVGIASSGITTPKFKEWAKDLPWLKTCAHSHKRKERCKHIKNLDVFVGDTPKDALHAGQLGAKFVPYQQFSVHKVWSG